MGITKQAKNIIINAKTSYSVKAKELIEIADKINYEAHKDNLVLNSNKRIDLKGDDGGVTHNDYTPPEIKIEEVKEYKLESTYAHDQLCSLADDLAEMPFMIFMLEALGNEIEIAALSKLYKDLSDRKIESPEIIVSNVRIGIGQGIAGYSNKKKKIIVYKKFLDEAINDNDKKSELLAALVEEYGHHIDNLLRTELATNGKEDVNNIDEGAKFAYQLFKFDIFKESQLTFAKAETPTFSGNLTVDLSKLHNALTTYVSENKQYDEIPGEEIPNFGAGRNRKVNKNAAFAHGDIEFEALVAKDLFKENDVLKIYYGNWLRDFSQVIVKITVRATNAGIKAQDYKLVDEALPMKLSHQGWVDLMEILAIKEFVYDPLKDQGKEPNDNFADLKKTFDLHYGGLTKDILGIYRPEEHLDNPKGLPDESDAKDDNGTIISFNYLGKTKKLYAGDNGQSWGIDTTKNMSKFFWIDFPNRPSSVTYVKEQFIEACKYGQSAKGLRHLGAGLHVLEDFFAHTNFTEVCLRKHGADVYPWIQDYKSKTWQQLPVVSGTFLSEDTLASVGPKMGDLLFDPKIKEYKRHKPGQRTLAQMFILKALRDFSKGQKSDVAKTNETYLGVKYSTWLTMFETFLSFQDFMATEYEKADKMEWNSTDFFEKLGARAAENFSKSMGYLVEIMTFFPKLIFNVILGSLDETVAESQSHLNTNYGNCPSHSQLAKDSYEHPLNKLSAEMSKIAVKDVGTKFKAGWQGEKLANYVVDTYFVHPEKSTIFDTIVKDWKNNKNNAKALERLKVATIFEHTHNQIQELNKESAEKIERIMEYFKNLNK